MAARAGKLTGLTGRLRGGSRVAGAFASADRAAAAAGVDGWLMIIVVGLVGFGLVMVYSASEALGYPDKDPNYFFAHQLIGATMGGVGLVVAARLDYHRLSRLARPVMFPALVLLVVVLIPHVGAQHFGAQRWFQVCPLSVQPSAIAVGVAVVFFARWLTDREASARSLRGVRDYLIVLFALLGLVLAERDLGSSIVIATTALILLALAGARKRHLVLILAMFGAPRRGAGRAGLVPRRPAGAPPNPCADALGSGFQNRQAPYAFGSGGISGSASATPCRSTSGSRRPHTDFIFAIIGEELGLIGTVAVLAAFLFLAWRGVRASLRAPDRFGRAARGRHHFVDLHAGLHQRDGGDRRHPHNGHPAAVHQLRWHLAGDHPRGHGHSAQHLRPGSTARDDESCAR